MFRIGDFSRIARVSARLLRFYDEIGLLTPAHADPQSGYRFYTAAQLSRLNRILVLKELGLSLDQIREVLEDSMTPEALRAMLLVRRSDAEQALAAEQERLRRIETRIAQIEAEGQLSSEDVVIRPEPARRVISLRRVVPSFAEARALIGALKQSVRAIAPKAPLGELVAVAHSADFEADHIDVEFGYTLGADARIDVPEGGELRIHELPAVERMAVCVRVGLPEDAHLVTGKIGRFIEASGDRLDGPGREVFLQPPRLEAMSEAVVEMQFPVTAAR